MPERLIDVPYRELHPMVRALSEAGFDDELAKELRNTRHAAIAVGLLQERFIFSQKPWSEMLFAPNHIQIARVRHWNAERDWGFEEADFIRVAQENPCPQRDPLYPEMGLVSTVLVPYLPGKKGQAGIQRTFDELWWAVGGMHASAESSDWYHYHRPSYLHDRDREAGLRWEVIDFGANRGDSPKSKRAPGESPDAGILAAAALHPNWARNLGTKEIPRVWLPGYKAARVDNAPDGGVPFLICKPTDRVEMGVRPGYMDYSDTAVPQFYPPPPPF